MSDKKVIDITGVINAKNSVDVDFSYDTPVITRAVEITRNSANREDLPLLLDSYFEEHKFEVLEELIGCKILEKAYAVALAEEKLLAEA